MPTCYTEINVEIQNQKGKVTRVLSLKKLFPVDLDFGLADRFQYRAQDSSIPVIIPLRGFLGPDNECIVLDIMSTINLQEGTEVPGDAHYTKTITIVVTPRTLTVLEFLRADWCKALRANGFRITKGA